MADLTPRTRSESFLNGEDLEPITRREHFYAGRESELPAGHQEPETREEWFIQKYRGGGGDVTVVPLSVTENGTYSEEGKAYSPVSVNVPLPENAYLLQTIEHESIATFTDGTDNFLKSLEVAIEPQQDLHGYDYPWVGGSGKNLFDFEGWLQSNNVEYTKTGNSFTFSTTSGALFSNPFSFSTENIDINFNVSVTLGTATILGFVFLDKDGTVISERISGKTTVQGVSKVKMDWSASGTVTITEPIISINDVPFEPYSNICPISGWDECKVTRTGKNLFDVANTATIYPKLKQGQTIYAKQNSSNDFGLYVLYEGDSQSTALQLNSNTKASMVLTKDVVQIAISDNARNALISQGKDIMVSTTDFTDIEPYTGNTYTINFVDGSSPLIVYGGTLDVVSGELRVTHGEVDLGDLDYIYESSWGASSDFYTNDIQNAVKAPLNDRTIANAICSQYNIVSRNTMYNSSESAIAILTNGIMKIRDSRYTSASDFKTAVTGQTLVYELATPLTIQLTPTIIKSLQGENNLFASTGEIERMQYWGR